MLDISSPLNDAASAIVDDSFLRCFTSAVDEPWNWNFYLLPLWILGVVLRNAIIFPLRLLTLLLGALVFIVAFMVAEALPAKHRTLAERRVVQFMAQIFVTSWTGMREGECSVVGKLSRGAVYGVFEEFMAVSAHADAAVRAVIPHRVDSTTQRPHRPLCIEPTRPSPDSPFGAIRVPARTVTPPPPLWACLLPSNNLTPPIKSRFPAQA